MKTKISIKKLNQDGFDHIFLAFFVVVLVAIVGTYYVVYSRAATSNYAIVNANGKCLNNQKNVAERKNPVEIYNCTGREAQQWTVKGANIVNSNGYCLAAQGREHGKGVVIQFCDNSELQGWEVDKASKKIASKPTGLCLDVTDGSSEDKALIIVATCDAASQTQKWTVKDGSDVPPTINSFTASPTTVTKGKAVNLSWSITGGNLCSVTPSGPTKTTATAWTTPALNKTTTYTLTCSQDDNPTASKTLVVTVTTPPVALSSMLMCVSDSKNNHGGTEDWDAWRTYRESSMLALANRTGDLRPKALAYSEGGANLGGSNPNYNTVYNHVLSKLNSFYYSNSTGQTHSSRWGIKLYWSNGNENHDKGALTLPHTTAKINAYTNSQKALYDAVHYVDPATKQRRFPDAFAGSNPTHNAEQSGNVEAWLHASAKYHDFVMWSMYPPGRQQTPSDPTFTWPTFDESQRTSREGFLIRTFYRTKQAELKAGHPLMIAVGEVGIGNDPDDGTTRPYYAVNGLAHSMVRLSEQYKLTIPFACWWDSQTDATSPQNILSDEQAGLNPTTRQAWQNWSQYDHLRGGERPKAWVGNPKANWKVTGSAPTR